MAMDLLMVVSDFPMGNLLTTWGIFTIYVYIIHLFIYLFFICFFGFLKQIKENMMNMGVKSIMFHPFCTNSVWNLLMRIPYDVTDEELHEYVS